MKNEKNNIFWIFWEKYGKISKKWKPMKMGQILMEKVRIDEKWKRIIFFGFFSEKYGKMSKKVKNDENGQILMKKVQIDEK